MLIVLFLVLHFNFLFVPCGGLRWLPASFVLHVNTHYRIVLYHLASLVVSRYITLVPYMGLRTGPACEAGLSGGMRRERVSPHKIKKDL